VDLAHQQRIRRIERAQQLVRQRDHVAAHAALLLGGAQRAGGIALAPTTLGGRALLVGRRHQRAIRSGHRRRLMVGDGHATAPRQADAQHQDQAKQQPHGNLLQRGAPNSTCFLAHLAPRRNGSERWTR